LQTFLVGQPEFRTILQSPDMQQLRQRVTATCHIGPLDQTDTQRYIEHRLKCAGATPERPKFDEAAFEAIFKASSGIPRRINMMCDRLLLSGYLNGRDSFGLEQVNEIVSEIADESGLSVQHPLREEGDTDWSESFLDDLSDDKASTAAAGKLRPPPRASHALTGHIATLSAEQYDIRLRRLEGSALRLERLNLEILVMLQKLIKLAMATPAPQDKEKDKKE